MLVQKQPDRTPTYKDLPIMLGDSNLCGELIVKLPPSIGQAYNQAYETLHPKVYCYYLFSSALRQRSYRYYKA
jgi:hypothetical protein